VIWLVEEASSAAAGAAWENAGAVAASPPVPGGGPAGPRLALRLPGGGYCGALQPIRPATVAASRAPAAMRRKAVPPNASTLI